VRPIYAVFITILVVSCGGETRSAATSSPIAPTPTPAQYVVSGTVRDDTGRPVEAARVFIGNRSSKTPSGFNTDTDAGGHYQGSIATGSWDVTVTKPGYEPVFNAVKVAADTVLNKGRSHVTGMAVLLRAVSSVVDWEMRR
jgi:carboxypeptidase family protein